MVKAKNGDAIGFVADAELGRGTLAIMILAMWLWVWSVYIFLWVLFSS